MLKILERAWEFTGLIRVHEDRYFASGRRRFSSVPRTHESLTLSSGKRNLNIDYGLSEPHRYGRT